MDIYFAIGAVGIGIGSILSIIGSIWLLVLAFREGMMWGLAAIFIPFVMLIFTIMYFGETWQAFALNMLGAIIAMMGFAVWYFAIGPEAFLVP